MFKQITFFYIVSVYVRKPFPILVCDVYFKYSNDRVYIMYKL